MKPAICYEMLVVNEETAKEALKQAVKWLGLAFHPDTPGEDYINALTRDKTMMKFEAEMFDANIHNAFELLPDIYSEAIDIWHELGMITNSEYYSMQGETFITDKAELIAAIEEVLLEVVGEHGEAFHVTTELYVEDRNSLTINLLDRDGTPKVMEMAAIIHTAIFNKTGRHLGMCNNSPTDGAILVMLDESSDNIFDPLCHKKRFINSFKEYIKNPMAFQGKHSDAIVFQVLDDTLDRECFGDLWEEALKPNYEFWHQVMIFARNGISL